VVREERGIDSPPSPGRKYRSDTPAWLELFPRTSVK
jgi:hypothetical protein